MRYDFIIFIWLDFGLNISTEEICLADDVTWSVPTLKLDQFGSHRTPCTRFGPHKYHIATWYRKKTHTGKSSIRRRWNSRDGWFACMRETLWFNVMKHVVDGERGGEAGARLGTARERERREKSVRKLAGKKRVEFEFGGCWRVLVGKRLEKYICEEGLWTFCVADCWRMREGLVALPIKLEVFNRNQWTVKYRPRLLHSLYSKMENHWKNRVQNHLLFGFLAKENSILIEKAQTNLGCKSKKVFNNCS